MSTNLLNVVVAESTAILKLLAGKDQALLIRGNAFLILNLALHIVDSIARLHLEGDGLTRQSFDEDLSAGEGAKRGSSPLHGRRAAAALPSCLPACQMRTKLYLHPSPVPEEGRRDGKRAILGAQAAKCGYGVGVGATCEQNWR